ncbi:phosphatase PAP2 family protein [Saccharicrinis sp. FJH62]|uniref:phosphatase PAP2 family protein n=1 Tax=Saccharicrinis sp. FJH62 TaxID=3344657 RepID=UPI0035D50CF2
MKKIDYAFLSYLFFSTFLMAFAMDASVHILPLILIRILILPIVFLLIYYEKRTLNPVVLLMRYAYPLILSGYFYSETVHYNKFFFSNIDPLLIRADEALFGMQPSLVFSEHFPGHLFSELMYFGYFSFYILLAGFAIYVFVKKRDSFKRLMFELTFSMYVFYLLFSIIPSEGPQFYFSYPENVVPGGYLFASAVHFIQKMAEQPTGAFPSSHVGISVIILILSRKYIPHFFHVIWPVVIILIFSTVYIKAHYAVDVIGGLILAPLILILSNLIYRIPDGWHKTGST